MCPYGLNLIGKTLKNIVTLLTLAILSVIVTACTVGARSAAVDSTPTSDFSLKDFMGRWYEIARFDHSFERDMEYVTADYILQDDGTVEVINSGMRGGEAHTARGRAKTTDTPGRLRVSFFWIFYSDYNVLAMCDNGGPLSGAARPNICGSCLARRTSSRAFSIRSLRRLPRADTTRRNLSTSSSGKDAISLRQMFRHVHIAL